MQNSTFRPNRFPALIVRKNEPKTTALIFPKGKMIITGAKSVEDAKKAAEAFTKDINNNLFK